VQTLAIDFALLGTLIDAWMLPAVAVAIPGGWLGQRFGETQVVLVGLGLMVLGSLLVAGAALE